MNSATRRRYRLGVGAIALGATAGLLGACGGGDDDATATASTASTSASSSTPSSAAPSAAASTPAAPVAPVQLTKEQLTPVLLTAAEGIPDGLIL